MHTVRKELLRDRQQADNPPRTAPTDVAGDSSFINGIELVGKYLQFYVVLTG